MKKILALGLFLSAIICLANGHIAFYNELPDGTTYTFDVYCEEGDRWVSEKDENPPLSPKKAIDSAMMFMKTIPLDKDFTGWQAKSVTLSRLSQEPEEWIYDVHFLAEAKKIRKGSTPCFTVVVRMDGSIPKPTIGKKEEKK